MIDRELLEAAAKAAGIELTYRGNSDAFYYDDPETGREQWYPLEHDGQALRLASALRIDIGFHLGHVRAHPRHKEILYVSEDHHAHSTIEAATRRAIVRAAAALAPHPSKSKGETE